MTLLAVKIAHHMDTLAAYLEAVRNLASMAGEKILEVYQTEFSVETKDDLTPVTQADIKANEVILAGLKALTPDIPVISEEDSLASFAERST